MTQPIQLHVGYVGITREGKRVEITRESSADPYIWRTADGEGFTAGGRYFEPVEGNRDIVGPWVETPVEPPADYKSHSDANYNDGKWHRWAGVGECPVHLDSVVEVMFIGLSSVNDFELNARSFTWDSVHAPIVAFRVTKEHVEPPKEPREFWVEMNNNTSVYATHMVNTKVYRGTTLVHVREVLTYD
jgi:hypothetical protein